VITWSVTTPKATYNLAISLALADLLEEFNITGLDLRKRFSRAYFRAFLVVFDDIQTSATCL